MHGFCCSLDEWSRCETAPAYVAIVFPLLLQLVLSEFHTAGTDRHCVLSAATVNTLGHEQRHSYVKYVAVSTAVDTLFYRRPTRKPALLTLLPDQEIRTSKLLEHVNRGR